MDTQIKTLTDKDGIVLPRTTTEAIATKDGELLDDKFESLEDAIKKKQDPIPDLESIRSGAKNGDAALVETGKLKTTITGKQDTIADLDTIRSGAANGTLALGETRAKEYKTILDTVLTEQVETVLQSADAPVSKCRITVFLKDGKVYTRRWYSTRSGAQNPPYLGCLTLANTEVVVFESEIFKDYILDTMNMYSINTSGSAYTTDKWSDVFKVYNSANAAMKSNMMFGASAGAGNKFPVGTRIIVEVITG